MRDVSSLEEDTLSRTYIMRHVPALPGTSRKIVAKAGTQCETKVRDEIFRQVAAILGTPVKKYPSYRYLRRSKIFISKAEWDLYDQIEESTIFPIRGPYWHPWRNGFPNNRAKTEEKRVANRKARRRTRHLLNHTQADHEELLLPRKSEYFDAWSFT